MSYRILLVGGGSGGHVYPLVAVAQALQKEAQDRQIRLKMLMVGAGDFLERAASEAGVPFRYVIAGKMRRYASGRNILDTLKLPISFVQSLWILYWYMPDAVFVKGGYASVMPTIAAWLYWIPIYIHESDAVPGLSNSILAKLSTAIFSSFENTRGAFPGKEVLVVGNPVRPELFGAQTENARAHFKLAGDRRTILVIGGSQGAQNINNSILNSLVRLTGEYQVIHQCGVGQFEAVTAEVERIVKEGQGAYGQAVADRYRLYPFLATQELAMAYAVSDIIISRGGAGGIFEAAAAGKPAIIIPIHDSPGGHQLANALEFAKFGAVIIEEPNLTPGILVEQIHAILQGDHYETIKSQVSSFAKPNAASDVARRILNLKS